jgi:ring-1,2-phenylacetyl-CoA epoxidase subunit PaaE
MSGAEFHALKVAEVTRLTDDSVAIELQVPAELADDYLFVAGQHVIVRRDIDGQDVRRSYSLCVPAGSGRLRIAVKEVPGGRFSTFANRELRAGETLQVTPPIGDFIAIPDPSSHRRYCAIAAGSGITPVISIVATLLESEPNCEVTLIYGNRSGRSIMFLDELAELKDRHIQRLTLVHVLSRESSQLPLLEGRLDAAKISELLQAMVEIGSIDQWFLCGPLGVVESAQQVLEGGGVAPDRIGLELFFDERPPARPRDVAGDVAGTAVRFTLGGRTSEVRVDPNGPPILDYVLTVRADAPFSCRNGACASCRAVVTSGAVTMHHNWSLTESEVAAGQVLSCQSHPMTDHVELTYDI